ncbi:uncharacterized protein LOC123306618 [Coccinella septempunctata]|uniref:uncharacterized protein LOC123306618 n=1 Tax=Coccinella septempunctata TaxID=41139 RepID=UPI001D0791F2|nr:uncharacterized protein LOC123306618 [Coccinella septempunctata]
MSSRILNMEISFTIKRIDNLSFTLAQLDDELNDLLPTYLEEFHHTQTRSYRAVFSKNRKILDKKFLDLKKRKLNSIKYKDKWFRNLTDTQIPNEVKVLLSLGPKFSIAPRPIRDLPIKNIIADVENAISNATNSQQNILRAKCTNAITNFVHSHNGSHSIEHYLFSNARKYIKEHNDLIITTADKGNVTVVLSTEQYIDKMNLLLQDSSIYKPLRKDPTNEIQNKNNKIVKQLKDKGYIDATIARKLTTYKALAPRIYGLPKIHKLDIPLRPIVCTIGSATAELSHFVTLILTEAFSDFFSYSVSDSFQFSIKINNITLPQGYKLVSLDAGSFFAQIFGCSMGNKISPILASIVMTVLLNYCIPLLPFQVPIAYQYVDDLFFAIPEDMTAEMLAVFNSFNTHIQFTVEEEVENGVPFLDTRVVRCPGNIIKLDWYQKPTSSGRYIHYRSNHSWAMKTNLIKGMFQRIIRICHPDFQKNAIKRLFSLFEDNGYPRIFLDRCLGSLTLGQVGERTPAEREETAHPIEQPRYVSLPFIPSLTPKLENILKEVENIRRARYNPLTHPDEEQLKVRNIDVDDD